nr:MAG TPA: hypothetical protein [Caudoviricetes sp.]
MLNLSFLVTNTFNLKSCQKQETIYKFEPPNMITE